MDTFKEVQNIFAANLRIPHDTIHPGSTKETLPGWDSVHHLLIVMDIEQAFGFKFALDEFGDLDSVDKLVQAVYKRVVP